MTYQIVLDTNVLIAGLRSRRGASFELLSRLGGEAFEINVSVPLVLEYEAVAREHARELGLTHADVDDVRDYLCAVGHRRQIFYLWRPFLPDPRKPCAGRPANSRRKRAFPLTNSSRRRWPRRCQP